MCEKNESVKDKNKQINSQLLNLEMKVTCVVCQTNIRNVIFEPCHHLATCISCSKKLDKCPLCRKNLKNKIRIFS